jgi:hypothetical protein
MRDNDDDQTGTSLAHLEANEALAHVLTIADIHFIDSSQFSSSANDVLTLQNCDSSSKLASDRLLGAEKILPTMNRFRRNVSYGIYQLNLRAIAVADRT